MILKISQMQLNTYKEVQINAYASHLLAAAAELRIDASSIGQDTSPMADFLDDIGQVVQYREDSDIFLFLYIEKLKREYRKLRLYRFSMLPGQSFELKMAERLKDIIEILTNLRQGEFVCFHSDQKEPTETASLRDVVTGVKSTFG